MKKKNMHKLSLYMQIGSGLLFGSSFFIKDNEKAVNRRYWSVGLFATAIGIEYLSKPTKQKS